MLTTNSYRLLQCKREVGLGSSQVAKHRPTFYEGNLGQYFRDLREDHGWTLNRAVFIARQRKLPVGLSALKWLEGGLTKNPRPELLRALSVLYGEPYGNMVREVARHVFAIKPHELLEEATPSTSMEGFVFLPLLSRPIASGQPLVVAPDPDRDSRLAFRQDLVKRFTRPVGLRVGRKVAAMKPTIELGDVVLIDQNVTRRRHPSGGHIYAVNYEPLTGKDGAGLQRVDLSGQTLVLSADNPNKSAHPTRTFEITRTKLVDILVGEVVWIARSVRPAT